MVCPPSNRYVWPNVRIVPGEDKVPGGVMNARLGTSVPFPLRTRLSARHRLRHVITRPLSGVLRCSPASNHMRRDPEGVHSNIVSIRDLGAQEGPLENDLLPSRFFKVRIQFICMKRKIVDPATRWPKPTLQICALVPLMVAVSPFMAGSAAAARKVS